MPIYIYIDVLIMLNIYITYFLLLASAKISHTPLKTSKCILGSVVGGLCSLMILIPQMNFIVNIFFKFLASVLIVFTAFGIKKYTLKLVLWFYAINFIFAGIILSLRYAFSLPFVRFSNSYFYMDFSLLSLVIFTALSYGIICIIRYFKDKNSISDETYKVIIKNKGKTIKLDGISDTGNSLADSFSGKSVIVCGKNDMEKLINVPDLDILNNNFDCWTEYYEKLKGFRLIPYSTIGESSLIPVFRPDEVLIEEEKSKKIKQTDALIGISGKNIKAVFNPELLK